MTGSGTTTLPPGELYPFLLKFLGTDLENLGVGFPGAWVSLTVCTSTFDFDCCDAPRCLPVSALQAKIS